VSVASKSARIGGIFVLTVLGLTAILVFWVFLADHTFPTSVDLHSFVNVDVDPWDKGLVSAEGTWRAERKHDRILYLTLSHPLNISHIRCMRQAGICEVATTRINQGIGGYYLVLEVNDLPIKNWNSKSVAFSIGDPSFNCFVETYVITRATKTVLGVSTADGKCDAPLPKGVQRVSDMKPLQLSLVSGSEFASQTRLEEEAPTRSLIFGIVALVGGAWVLFCLIWMVRVARR